MDRRVEALQTALEAAGEVSSDSGSLTLNFHRYTSNRGRKGALALSRKIGAALGVKPCKPVVSDSDDVGWVTTITPEITVNVFFEPSRSR